MDDFFTEDKGLSVVKQIISPSRKTLFLLTTIAAAVAITLVRALFLALAPQLGLTPLVSVVLTIALSTATTVVLLELLTYLLTQEQFQGMREKTSIFQRFPQGLL